MVTAMSSAPSSALRQLLDNRISQLSGEVETLFAEAREQTRREFADQLNQTVRRLRQSEDLEALTVTLLDAAGLFSTSSALFVIESDVAKGRRMRGVTEETSERFKSLAIPLAEAAALAGAVETRDPVTAVTTVGEVSLEMRELVGHSSDGRVSIFPLVVRDEVPALLYAWGTVHGAAMELLTQVAAGVWSELSRPAPPELVTIAPAPVATVVPPRPSTSWDQLSPDEQQIHFSAQRFARVQVAEMRLYHADAVQSGRALASLYGKLRKPIDIARENFRQNYFKPCPTMVDYLHLELVRTLANEDPELLGKDYPGPMA